MDTKQCHLDKVQVYNSFSLAFFCLSAMSKIQAYFFAAPPFTTKTISDTRLEIQYSDQEIWNLNGVLVQSGPLLVISRVITPLIGVITSVTHLLKPFIGVP